MQRTDQALKIFNSGLPFMLKDTGLLKKVFVHTSFLNEKAGKGLESNERLEFLGDSILGSAISRMLFDRFPDADEGTLTSLRARLVNKKTLASIAAGLRMNEYLLLGKGEQAGGGDMNPTILSAAFEALVAAVYLDSGIKKAFSFIEHIFSHAIEGVAAVPGHFDFKPLLQETAQRLYRKAPSYSVVSETGPAHSKIFEIEVSVNGELLGRGLASNKKDAEQAAAGEALKRLKERHADILKD
ncbi:MAG: ribonuclease III [Deltaproteobacteria bacterium]|nr:ribonuclease III [Deltaproteobacteria bacterium]